MTKSATDWRAMYRRLGEETLALRQRAEAAEQERDALREALVEIDDRLSENPESYADGWLYGIIQEVLSRTAAQRSPGR